MKLMSFPSALTMLALSKSLFHSTVAFGPVANLRLGAKVAANATERRLFNLFGSTASSEYPIMTGEETMSQKGHGTSERPVQNDLRVV